MNSRSERRGKSKQHRLYTQRRTCLAQPSVERAERCAMIAADRKVQSISGAQAQYVLLDEAGRRAELQPRHRDDGKALRGEPSKCSQHIGSVSDSYVPSAQLD